MMEEKSWRPTSPQYRNILFTMEIEKDEEIAVLDVQICRNGDRWQHPGNLNAHKSAHKQYLNFRSHHHSRIKFSIVQCLKELRLVKLLNNVFIANRDSEEKT